ncbi:hypothetical protein J5Y04_31385 [Kitasatospora sp. RG8]|uniref:hypothetical protein n=1 Tax=Kitasatospora sp. RG8 TaxID=2820815 RepID=UPI001ADF78A5|nr:hypothetical protein [Kitasatospora sp. RG8]MBP0454011.1 hypothetical protein [Kitasatospora sp. RG8]
MESAAHATVQPNHARATLGTMLGELPKIAHKLVFDIEGSDPQDGVEMVRRMMLQLWDGQTQPTRQAASHPQGDPGRGRGRRSPRRGAGPILRLQGDPSGIGPGLAGAGRVVRLRIRSVVFSLRRPVRAALKRDWPGHNWGLIADEKIRAA